jgi:hypothetical protein
LSISPVFTIRVSSLQNCVLLARKKNSFLRRAHFPLFSSIPASGPVASSTCPSHTWRPRSRLCIYCRCMTCGLPEDATSREPGGDGRVYAKHWGLRRRDKYQLVQHLFGPERRADSGDGVQKQLEKGGMVTEDLIIPSHPAPKPTLRLPATCPPK